MALTQFYSTPYHALILELRVTQFWARRCYLRILLLALLERLSLDRPPRVISKACLFLLGPVDLLPHCQFLGPVGVLPSVQESASRLPAARSNLCFHIPKILNLMADVTSSPFPRIAKFK
jgi:hypothetical protein